MIIGCPSSTIASKDIRFSGYLPNLTGVLFDSYVPHQRGVGYVAFVVDPVSISYGVTLSCADHEFFQRGPTLSTFCFS